MKKGDYRIILTVILSLCFLLINKNYINAESENWTVSLSEIGSGWGYVLNNGSNYTKDTFIQFFNLKNKKKIYSNNNKIRHGRFNTNTKLQI